MRPVVENFSPLAQEKRTAVPRTREESWLFVDFSHHVRSPFSPANHCWRQKLLLGCTCTHGAEGWFSRRILPKCNTRRFNNLAIKYNSDICKSGFQMIADNRIERCTMQFPLQKQSPSLISLKNACLFIRTRLESEAAIQTTPDLSGSLRRFYSNKFSTFYKVFIPFCKTKL